MGGNKLQTSITLRVIDRKGECRPINLDGKVMPDRFAERRFEQNVEIVVQYFEIMCKFYGKVPGGVCERRT